MFNQLVIIGNGFDLAHGLKTTYHDFFIWYLNKIISSIRHQNQYMYQDKLVHIENLGELYASQTITNAEHFENILRLNETRIKYRPSYLFTKIFASSKIHGWVDIENMYYEELIRHTLNVSRGDVN